MEEISTEREQPVFDHCNITVIFVLGGPGTGKGTQCGQLVKDYGFCHLSAGDLLRAEQQREGSKTGDLIRTCIKEGNIVPMEITVKLLEIAMKGAMDENREEPGWTEGKGRFLIDGFPREMEQAKKFEKDVCLSSLVIVFSAPENVMLQRLLERGKTSGREDDNIESIEKRFRTHKEQTVPVVEYYKNEGRVPVAIIDSSRSVEEVHHDACRVIDEVLPQLKTTAVLAHPTEL